MTVKAQSVTAQHFDVLGIRPMLGRAFQSGDDQTGAPLAILGQSLWQTRFAGDSAIVGKRVLLDQQPYDVVGVMGPRGDLDADLWIPMNVVAEAAASDVELIARRLAEQLPSANKGHDVHVSSLYDEVVGDARRPFYVALGAAAFIREAMRMRLRRGRVFDAGDARVSVPLIRWHPQQSPAR